MTTTSVVVPVHRLDKGFSQCLQSLSLLAPQPNEVMIVLDGLLLSEAEDHIAWHPEHFRVLENRERSGPAAARNQGAAQSTGDLLVFVDSDVAVPVDLVTAVRTEFEKDPHLAALLGSYDSAPGYPNFFSQFKNLMHHYVHQHAREKATTFWGACGAIRRAEFEGIGGFDESLDWLEDVDLGMRLSKRGRKIKLLKSLQVKHWKRWAMGSLLKSDIFHRALPWTRLVAKHGVLQNDLNTDYRSRASAAFIFLGLGLFLFGTRFPHIRWSVGLIGLILLALNMPFYAFLARKKGLSFLLPAILWHWFYYVYSSLAFVVGIILAFLKA